MMRRGRNLPPRSSRGFTVVGVMIAIVLSTVVLGAMYRLLDSQGRFYSLERETLDARESLRATAALLTWELRNEAASGGDLYAIGTNSVRLRSTQAMGVICSRTTVGSATRFGLQATSGYFQATADDSALVYSLSTDTWSAVKVVGVWEGSAAWSSGGTPVCFWGDSTTSVPRPQVAVELQGPGAVLADLEVGAPIRLFRQVEYGLFQQNGRWWLGRRQGSATQWEELTGPLLAPANGGLVLTYYDATGSMTSDPAQVARVDLVLRAESFGKVRGFVRSGFGNVIDSLRITASLRNNATP
ncbi:MAG: PilW family protein [Gemmatimonadota bacterium]